VLLLSAAKLRVHTFVETLLLNVDLLLLASAVAALACAFASSSAEPVVGGSRPLEASPDGLLAGQLRIGSGSAVSLGAPKLRSRSPSAVAARSPRGAAAGGAVFAGIHEHEQSPSSSFEPRSHMFSCGSGPAGSQDKRSTAYTFGD